MKACYDKGLCLRCVWKFNGGCSEWRRTKWRGLLRSIRFFVEVNADPLGHEMKLVHVFARSKIEARSKAKDKAWLLNDVLVVNRVLDVEEVHNFGREQL